MTVPICNRIKLKKLIFTRQFTTAIKKLGIGEPFLCNENQFVLLGACNDLQSHHLHANRSLAHLRGLYSSKITSSVRRIVQTSVATPSTLQDFRRKHRTLQSCACPRIRRLSLCQFRNKPFHCSSCIRSLLRNAQILPGCWVSCSFRECITFLIMSEVSIKETTFGK